MPLPLILVDDPTRHTPYELTRVLSGRCPARLVLVLEPEPGDQPADPSGDGTGLAAACAAIAGAPVALPRYRAVRHPPDRRAAVELPATDAADVLVGLVPPPFVLVVYASAATLPLVEALHADARTQPVLKLAVTGWRLDADYNLAQKLVAQGKVHYHEHGMSLARTLCRRLRLMLQAHADRATSGPAVPTVPAGAAVNPAE